MRRDTKLPSTWTIATLSELGRWYGGGTPSKANPAYWTNGTIPWVSPKDMKVERIHSSEDRITEEALASSATNLIPTGSVLVVTRSGILKHSLPVAVTHVDCAINQDIKALVPFEGFDPTYITYALRAFEAELLADATKSGTTVQSVELGSLLRFGVPIAPTQEQRRIVGEIEKEFTRLDAAVASLKKVQANLKRYRAAVLKAACEGRLVPTEAELARAEGRGYENGELLLNRINRRKTPSHPISQIRGLPEGWTTATVEHLGEVGTGATPLRSNPAYYEGGDIPWVTSSALNRPFVLSVSEFVTAKALAETNLTLYPKGTLLLAMYGEGKTRGKCSELQIEACTNQAIAALVLQGSAELCRPYLKIFLSKNYEDLRRLSSGGVQPNLNLSLIKNIKLPLPPLAEQDRIVREVERVLSVVDELESTADTSFRRAAHLRQSILSRAFEGHLVSQDPEDEPASILLERIREAKASKQAEPRAKRRKAAPAAPPAPPPLPASVAKPAPPAEPVPEPLEPDFLGFPRGEQMEVVWDTLLGLGTLEKDEAIRAAAGGLRDLGNAQFKRLRQDGPLYRDIAAAIEKGVREGWLDRPRRGSVRAVLRDPKEYAIDDWQRCLLAVMGPEPADVDTTLRAAAEWAREAMGLEFVRLREDGAVLTGLREALEETVREKRIVRKGGQIRNALA